MDGASCILFSVFNSYVINVVFYSLALTQPLRFQAEFSLFLSVSLLYHVRSRVHTPHTLSLGAARRAPRRPAAPASSQLEGCAILFTPNISRAQNSPTTPPPLPINPDTRGRHTRQPRPRVAPSTSTRPEHEQAACSLTAGPHTHTRRTHARHESPPPPDPARRSKCAPSDKATLARRP